VGFAAIHGRRCDASCMEDVPVKLWHPQILQRVMHPFEQLCVGTRSVPQLLRWMPAQPVPVLPEA
jgi:hypothetical protein